MKSLRHWSNNHRQAIFVSIIIFIIVLSFLICLLVSYYALYLTENKAYVKIINNTNLIILSDLHDSSFGKNNAKLIDKVRQCEPDVIFTVGDMVSEYNKDYSYLSPLYQSLAEIAPVYCSLGNHELSHPESEKIKGILKEHATLLDNEYTETNINGTDVRIGGLMGYHPDNVELNEFVRDFADTEKFTLLLSHCPEYYVWGVDEVKIDLMISGHTHGGQVIVPFKGGLYAPEQGYFPYYDYGVFYEENTTLVITRGLGTSKQKVPRFNNPPEILCLTLEPEVQNE